MPFEDLETKYYLLRGKHATGLLSDEEFLAEVDKLTLQDSKGRWWTIGARTGKWYVSQEGEWVQAEPPRAPERVCPHCGAPVKEDALFCVSCGHRLVAKPAPPPKPLPPRAPVVPVRRRPSRLLIIGLIGLILLSCALLGTYEYLSPTKPLHTFISGLLAQLTPYPTPTGVVEATATPTAPPTGVAEGHPLEIVSHTMLRSEQELTFMGEVENVSDQAIDSGYYAVLIRLLDKGGNPIETKFDIWCELLRPRIEPGQRSPFLGFTSGDVYDFSSEDVDGYKVEVQRSPHPSPAPWIELAMLDHARRSLSDEWDYVEGHIKNDSDLTTDSVNVYLVLYDEAGKVVDLTSGEVMDKELAPGETTAFESFGFPSSGVSYKVVAIASAAEAVAIARPTALPPSPTSAPTATPAMRLLFQDDFSDHSGGWIEFDDENGRAWIEDGEYHALVKKTDTVVLGWRKEGSYADLIFEAEARQVSGPDINAYGLLFRGNDKDNFYRFSISSLGKYEIDKRLEGEWVSIKEWTHSDAINQGVAMNHLKVICRGNTLEVYVNGQHLATVTDPSFAEGYIALTAAAYQKPDVHVAFDNVKVWEGTD